MKKIILMAGLFLAGVFISTSSYAESDGLLGQIKSEFSLRNLTCEAMIPFLDRGTAYEVAVWLPEYSVYTKNMTSKRNKKYLNAGHFAGQLHLKPNSKDAAGEYMLNMKVIKFSNNFRQYTLEWSQEHEGIAAVVSVDVDLDAKTVKASLSDRIIEGTNCR